jgi:TP901 family phage tail tape measure protein
MPGRDLMVRIRADVSDFRNKMRLAQGQVAQFDQAAQRSNTRAGKALNALGLSYRGVGLMAGTAVVGLGGAMVKAAADFDEGMSNVKATGVDAVKNINALREAALKAGADTKYSATEAAGGVEALAKAGVTSADILGGGLSGALDLAAAGNLDVAGSAEAAASAMNQFGLKGKDVPHIADLLAAAAGKAQGEVSDMAMALNQSGLVANTFGYSIEETTGVLAEFAASGLVGSDAGTSLKTMLIRLAAPTDVAAATMKKYGIQTRNANGELKNASQIAGELQQAFKGVDDAERDAALSTIFGQDAIRGASILYQDGAEKAAGWTDAVDDAGFAAETAATKMDNLKGDLEQLKGSLDTLFIKGGGGSQGPLREFVQGATDLANALGKVKEQLDGIGVKPLSKSGNPAGIFGDLFQTGRIQANTEIPFKVAFKLTQTDSAKQIAKIAQDAGLKARDIKIALKLTGSGPKQIKDVLDQMQRASRIKMLQNLGYKGKDLQNALRDLEKIDKAAKKPKRVKVGAELDPKDKGKLARAIDDSLKQKKKPKPRVDTAGAKSDVDKIQSYLDGLKRDPVYVGVTGPGAGKWAGGVVGFAGGGKVPGTPPSDPRKDNVAAATQHGTPYAIRSGEWIINERASRLNDRLLRAINGGADFSRMPGLAGGGVVGGDLSGGGTAVGTRILSGKVTINGLDAHMTLVAQDVVDGHATHQSYRGRAGGK